MKENLTKEEMLIVLQQHPDLTNKSALSELSVNVLMIYYYLGLLKEHGYIDCPPFITGKGFDVCHEAKQMNWKLSKEEIDLFVSALNVCSLEQINSFSLLIYDMQEFGPEGMKNKKINNQTYKDQFNNLYNN